MELLLLVLSGALNLIKNGKDNYIASTKSNYQTDISHTHKIVRRKLIILPFVSLPSSLCFNFNDKF